MSTEISISDFKHASVFKQPILPNGVQHHDDGYIIAPDETGKCVGRVVLATLSIIFGVFLGISIYVGKTGAIIGFSIAIFFCLLAIFRLTFSTTLIFHVNKKYIEKQVTSTLCCVPPKTTIVPFGDVKQLFRWSGRKPEPLVLQTSVCELRLSEIVYHTEISVWRDWLTRMGINAELFEGF